MAGMNNLCHVLEHIVDGLDNASFEYELSEYKVSNLVKVDILVSGKPVDAFIVSLAIIFEPKAA